MPQASIDTIVIVMKRYVATDRHENDPNV